MLLGETGGFWEGRTETEIEGAMGRGRHVMREHGHGQCRHRIAAFDIFKADFILPCWRTLEAGRLRDGDTPGIVGYRTLADKTADFTEA